MMKRVEVPAQLNARAHDERPPFMRMLEPRSVAIVGGGRFAKRLLREARRAGFSGDLFAVGSDLGEEMGLRSYRSIDEIDAAVDLVLMAVPNSRIEEELKAAAGARAGSAVIFTSCYEPDLPGEPSLVQRLTDIAHSAGMAVCGGNSAGFLHLESGLGACGLVRPPRLAQGTIAFISHSRSAFAAMANNDRDLGFNVLVSAGLEFVTTTADYLSYALQLSSTRVAALFLETVRDPHRFRIALKHAQARDVPVVALKVGRRAAARRLVAAHSGALAGDDAAFDALFDAHGVIRVQTLDEMADTLELLSSGRRSGPGRFASIHTSGGERGLVADVATDVELEFADAAPATVERLRGVLEEGRMPEIPLDVGDSTEDPEHLYRECIAGLLEDPGVAALALNVDLTTESDAGPSSIHAVVDLLQTTAKPVAAVSNLAAAIDRSVAGRLRAAGVPVLQGTHTGLLAFKHLFDLRDERLRPRPAPGPLIEERYVRWARRLSAGGRLTEVEALAMIADYGIRVVVAETVHDRGSAVAAAREIGYPVALKTGAWDVVHKTEEGGVVLGLHDPEAVALAYEEMADRLGPDAVVAAMAAPGTELALGVHHDPQFGPMVMLAAGGVLVEILHDRTWALPPLDIDGALRMLERLHIARALQGVRGRLPGDFHAVAAAAVSLANLCEEIGDHIQELDVNPLVVYPHGCVAVDALVIPRSR